MSLLLPYLTIIRINNAVMAGIAVALGFWLGGSPSPFHSLALLIAAAVTATGFGNVINDLRDIATDRISHPTRPLPRGEMSPRAAGIFAAVLAIASLACASLVSLHHAAATLAPVLLLAAYARFLKGTPLLGNLVVSLLVAYALLFGGLRAPAFPLLIIPAVLAFLLNLLREIIKDLEDEKGDHEAGLKTTAVLPVAVIRTIVYALSTVYLLLLFTPWLLHHFGPVYAGLCAAGVIPIHCFWLWTFSKKNWRSRLSLLSGLMKTEMALGLLALAVDRLFAR